MGGTETNSHENTQTYVHNHMVGTETNLHENTNTHNHKAGTETNSHKNTQTHASTETNSQALHKHNVGTETKLAIETKLHKLHSVSIVTNSVQVLSNEALTLYLVQHFCVVVAY